MTFWLMNSFRSAKRLIIRFLGLSLPEKSLLIKALILLYAIRVGLWTLPFCAMNRMTSGFRMQHNHELFAENRIIWAVKASSRFVPCATCLTQAMAARMLLSSYGHKADLRIGVLRENGQLKAHAWLENENRVLIGGVIKTYATLPLLNRTNRV
jgi:hypothetical protein